jgi:hypothetical protein
MPFPVCKREDGRVIVVGMPMAGKDHQRLGFRGKAHCSFGVIKKQEICIRFH